MGMLEGEERRIRMKAGGKDVGGEERMIRLQVSGMNVLGRMQLSGSEDGGLGEEDQYTGEWQGCR